MADNIGRKTNLRKYLPHHGKWQFFPVARVNGRPRPELVIVEGQPRRGTSGTFYLQWRENGVRRTRPVGTSPREALDACSFIPEFLSARLKGPKKRPRRRRAAR